jgi:Carboxypeptidase regulatory-like domain
MHSFRTLKAHLVLIGLMLCSLGAWGQQTSTILGTITDSSGAAVSKANVVVTNTGTSLQRTAVSDSAGAYTVPNLPPGHYRLDFSMPGFSQYVMNDVKIDVGQVARLDAALKAGGATQKVTVRGSEPLLQTADAQISNVVENATIVGLPLNGRNFTQLNLLIPGVTTGSSNNIVGRNGYGARASGVAFSVNGQRSTNSQFLLDGISFLEPEIGSAAFSPSIDAIQEFRVQTNNASAEFGTTAGGQINMITKTGTSSFHGDVYEFLRNDDFDAKNFFAGTAKPELRQNQFGGTLGGPILKNKLLFFGSYDGTRLVKGLTQTGLVPTVTQASGNLAYLLTPPSGGTPIQLINPYTGVPVPGDNITTVNPIAAQMLANYIPLPNTSAGGAAYNYISNNPIRVDTNQYLGRVDYNITAKDTAWVRYIYERTNNQQPKFFPTDGLTEKLRSFGQAAGWSHIFTPKLLNEFKFGVTHFAEDLHLANAGTNDVVSKLGQTGLCTDPRCWGVPSMSVSGFAIFGEHGFSGPNAGGLGGGFKSGPVAFHSNILQVDDVMYWNNGAHSVRSGMEFDARRFGYDEALDPRGVYTFDGRFTLLGGGGVTPNANTALADFLFGVPVTSLRSITVFNPDLRSFELHPWFQDDWRITQNLTVNLGLRYEFMQRPTSANNTVANLNYSTPTPTLVTAANAGAQGFPRALVDNDYKDFAPRVGIAYLIPGHRSTVVRAGYGIFYQREADNSYIDLAINPPLVTQSTLTLSASQVPSYSFANPFALGGVAASTYFSMQKNWQDAYSQQWNLALQTQVPGGISLQAAYVANKVSHLSKNIPINQATPGTTPLTSREPYPTLGSVSYFNSQGASTYNSLQLQAERRLSSNLTFLAAYTYARCIDDASAGSIGETDTGIQNIHAPGLQKGLCSQDTRNRFTFSYVYKLPFGRNGIVGANSSDAVNEIIGGWEMSGVLTSSTGQPFTPIMSGDNAGVGFGASYPNIIGNPNSGPHSVLHAFNTAAFVAAHVGTFGNSRRNIVIGPGVNTLDMALMKHFPIHEQMNLEFRAEVFNMLNHPNFNPPGATFGTSTFGVITAAGDPRIMQFSLKFLF